MKIGYFILIILLFMKNYHCFKSMSKSSLTKSSNPFLNFIQLANKKSSNLNLSQAESKNFKYDVKIIIIKQTDEKDDQPLEFDNQLLLTKETIEIYEKGTIVKKVPYLE